jgi:lysophospholipase L1-like esterase
MLPRLIAAALLALPASAQTSPAGPAQNPPQLKPLPFSIGGRVLAMPSMDPRFGAHAFVYQWPGTYFEAAFQGTQVCFAVSAGDVILHFSLDDQPPTALVKPGPGAHCASSPVAGRHRIRVDIVTESQSAPGTFLGFAIPAGERALGPPHRTRQIEFIGDSHTVGYGNTSPTRKCTEDQVWATTNTSQAFGALVARHYNADYQINAISGHGIVRNYNGSPGDPVPVAYPWILFDHKQIYGDSNWHPQVIVIALGTNDFTTKLNPGEKWKTRDQLHADYEATYLRYLETLRAENAHAYFILWATDMADGEIETEVSKVADQWKAKGETRVAYLPVDGLSFTACNYHPSLADDQTIAAELEKDIDAVPGIWSLQR